MCAARKSLPINIVESGKARVDASRDATARVPQPEAEDRPAFPAFEVLKPRRFTRVPTHVVGVAQERRAYPRAALQLPLRLRRVAGQPEPVSVTLLTQNISSSGVFFLCPSELEPGTPIELEVALVERPLGRGSVRMATAAHIVRVEPSDIPGWHGLAASFDDITFYRDEPIPPRFQDS